MFGVLAFVVLIGVLITVHELGHFLVAKATGVRVLTFSIGFGPRLFGFRRGDTDYRISVFPLGGYVRMYGDDLGEDVPPEERHRAFLHKAFLPKSAIAVAGPLANLLLPVLLFFGLFVGKESVADAVVGTVVPGEPAAAAGLQPGDRVLRVDGTPVQVFSDLAARVEKRPGVPMVLTVQRGADTLELHATPRSADAPTPFDHHRKVGRLGVLAARELPVVIVQDGSPAYGAGLRSMDKVQSVDEVAISTRDELLAALDARRDTPWTLSVVGASDKTPRSVVVPPQQDPPPTVADDRFAVTEADLQQPALLATLDQVRALTAAAARQRAERRGVSPVDGVVTYVAEGTAAHSKQLEAGVDRIVAVDGRALRTPNDLEAALQSSPDAVHVIGVLGNAVSATRLEKPAASVLAFRMGPPPQRQLKSMKVLGTAIGAAYGDAAQVIRPVPPLEAASRAVAETWKIAGDVVRGFAMLFSGKVGMESLGGPITIFNLAGEAAAIDLLTYVRLMALISINLGLVNLLPIPILDGGHLLMFTVEAVQRKRLTIETRVRATRIGLILVGLLMVIAIGNDLLGLIQ